MTDSRVTATASSYMTPLPDALRSFATFVPKDAVAHHRATTNPDHSKLDAWFAEHASSQLMPAVRRWVANNDWFQRYQAKLATGAPPHQAAMEAQDDTWSGRRAVLSEQELAAGAVQLMKQFDDIVSFLFEPKMPAGLVTELHRGHALERTEFERFLDIGFANSPLLRSYSVDRDFVPRFYASHNLRKLAASGVKCIVPYVLHVELRSEDQALLWIPTEAALQPFRDDRWQSEIVAPAKFDVEVTCCEEENIDGVTVTHLTCRQR